MTWYPEPAWPCKGIDSAGCDSSPGNVCTPEWLAAVPEVVFCARYLRLDGEVRGHVVPGGDWAGVWSLSLQEAEWIGAAGKALIPVQFGPARGDMLGTDLGRKRGEAAVQSARLLGLLPGGHLWCDVEGARAHAAGEAATRAYIDTWSSVVVQAGYQAGLYVGDDAVRPTGPGLYRLPHVTSYWGSYPAKRAPYMEPLPRGWSIRQGLPTAVAGLQVDWDEITVDGKGQTPCWYRWLG
jgi:hypothetical protein